MQGQTEELARSTQATSADAARKEGSKMFCRRRWPRRMYRRPYRGCGPGCGCLTLLLWSFGLMFVLALARGCMLAW